MENGAIERTVKNKVKVMTLQPKTVENSKMKDSLKADDRFENFRKNSKVYNNTK